MPVPVLSTVKKRAGSKRKLSIDPDQDKPFLFCFGRAITWFRQKDFSQKDESEEACTEAWSCLKEISGKEG